MKKVLKWLGFVLGGVAGLVLVALLAVYLLSWRKMNRHYTAAAQQAVTLPTDAASIAEGARLATVHGCIACHGEQLEGGVVFDIPNMARLVAPNISGAAEKYTAVQLATVIRQGIKPDGSSIWIMPAATLRHLDDADLARIIAFVRSVPARDGTHEVSTFRAGLRAAIVFGAVKSGAEEAAESSAATAAQDVSNPIDHGRYLVMSNCTECHGQKLEGWDLAATPPLIVAKGYSPQQFSTLMHQGIGVGGRKLDLMREVALARYAHFTDQEISDVYAFLQSR